MSASPEFDYYSFERKIIKTDIIDYADETKNLTAKIKSISPLGVAEVEFNATMFDNFTNPLN